MYGIVHGVKQHDRPVRETRDRDKPEEARVPEGILDGAQGADTEGEIDADHHLVVDRVVGRPAPAPQQVEIDCSGNAQEAGKSPQGHGRAKRAIGLVDGHDLRDLQLSCVPGDRLGVSPAAGNY